MNFLDKVKQHAALAKAAANDKARQGQANIDAVEAAIAADSVLRVLGAQILFERTGRGTVTTEEAIGSYLELLKEYEEEYGSLNETASDGEAEG